jgi:uncharacterized protein YceH (UPF0502 family)
MHSKKFWLAVLFLGLTNTTLTSYAQGFQVEELGDDELSCQALFDGTKQMDALIQSAHQTQTQNQQQRSNSNPTGGLLGEVARENGSSEGARIAHLFGRMIANAGATNGLAQQSPEPLATRAQAQARKQHLTQLFRSKKCKVSALRK